jgi:crossover junction endodeoxyribonuclease RusA
VPNRSVSYRLPWPPSVNRIWRAVGGRVILSAAARQYAIACANALPAGTVDPLRGRLAVTLQMRPPTALNGKRWDILNREKLLCDVLTAQRIWLDDEQIDVAMVMRGEPIDKGCVDILINEI